ncbi:MAG: zinc metallopeptidase, partial [Coprobacillaceae bacterium]
MGGYYGYGYGFDFSNPYNLAGLVLILIGTILVIVAQSKVSNSYNKYSRIHNHGNFTGFQVAQEILDSYDLRDVEINVA